MNGRVIDVMSAYHFAPTLSSARNLADEHLQGKVVVTGNTVIDALTEIAARIRRAAALRARLDAHFPFLDSEMKTLLVTGHRRESFGGGFINICRVLRELARREDPQIVYPVHLNHNVAGPVQDMLGGLTNVHLIAPQAYLEFVYLMERSHIILTDSGGVQEDAPSLGKPVLVMREVARLLDDPRAHALQSAAINPYGDGKAAQRIVDTLAGRAPSPRALPRMLTSMNGWQYPDSIRARRVAFRCRGAFRRFRCRGRARSGPAGSLLPDGRRRDRSQQAVRLRARRCGHHRRKRRSDGAECGRHTIYAAAGAQLDEKNGSTLRLITSPKFWVEQAPWVLTTLIIGGFVLLVLLAGFARRRNRDKQD